MIKKYKNKYDKNAKWTTRKECRKQMQEYIKTDKEYRERKREGSNITKNMVVEEFK